MSTHVDDHRTACRHHFCCQFHIPDRSTASHHQILPHMSICIAASSNWPMSSHHRADNGNIIFTVTVGNYNTSSCRSTDNQFSQLSSVHNQFRGLETLRSASSLSLSLRRTRLSNAGDQAFCVAVACTWNSRPQHVKSTPSMSVLRGRLKAFLFRRSFP